MGTVRTEQQAIWDAELKIADICDELRHRYGTEVQIITAVAKRQYPGGHPYTVCRIKSGAKEDKT